MQESYDLVFTHTSTWLDGRGQSYSFLFVLELGIGHCSVDNGRKKGDVGMGVVGSRPTSYVLAATMWLCRT